MPTCGRREYHFGGPLKRMCMGNARIRCYVRDDDRSCLSMPYQLQMLTPSLHMVAQDAPCHAVATADAAADVAGCMSWLVAWMPVAVAAGALFVLGILRLVTWVIDSRVRRQLASARARWEHQHQQDSPATMLESFTLGWLNVTVDAVWLSLLDKHLSSEVTELLAKLFAEVGGIGGLGSTCPPGLPPTCLPGRRCRRHVPVNTSTSGAN